MWLVHLEPPEMILIVLLPLSPGYSLISPHCSYLLLDHTALALFCHGQGQEVPDKGKVYHEEVKKHEDLPDPWLQLQYTGEHDREGVETATLTCQSAPSDHIVVTLLPRTLQTRLVLLAPAVLLPLQHLLLADKELLGDDLLAHGPLVSGAMSDQLDPTTHIVSHIVPE